MKLLRRIRPLRHSLETLRQSEKSIGFVPTMGGLHEGHLSLVRAAKRDNDCVVVSIFVNPMQFGPKEDFKRYPRSLARDLALLRKEGVNFVLCPPAVEIYPVDFQTHVSVKNLSAPLCGRTRPTHFSGVATVVLKLLNIVKPHRLYLGQKDFQQARVLEQMIEDLGLDVRVRCLPIVREADGVAMSSRNVFLKKEERRVAPLLYQALLECRRQIKCGEKNTQRLLKKTRSQLDALSCGRLDYLEIVDAGTLRPVVKLKKGQTVLAALAYFFSNTRLIDNELIKG